MARQWLLRLTGLGLLLILPGWAVATLIEQFAPRWVLGYLAVISIATALTNWADKHKAQTDQWRTPERTLHFLELVGGWPAAFITQQLIRHKTAKTEYQFTFWLIVILHQYLAFDLVYGWKWSLFEHVKPMLESG